MVTQLVLATLLVGLASFFIIARRLRVLGFKKPDDVHRLQSPVRFLLLLRYLTCRILTCGGHL